jgi:hypothetical protein
VDSGDKRSGRQNLVALDDDDARMPVGMDRHPVGENRAHVVMIVEGKTAGEHRIGRLTYVVIERSEGLDPRSIRLPQLRIDHGGVDARDQVDDGEMVGDGIIDALHPLARLALILPPLNGQADLLSDPRFAIHDAAYELI